MQPFGAPEGNTILPSHTCETEVFQRLRNARFGRSALLAAALLAVVASVGLHPEPVGDEHVTAHRGLASAHTDETAHGCAACLTHTAALASPPLGLLSGTPGQTSLRLVSGSPFAGRLAGRELSGRSPPRRS